MNHFPYRARFEMKDDLCFIGIYPRPCFHWDTDAQREAYEIKMADVMRPYQGMKITPEIVQEMESAVEDFLLELITIGVIASSLPFGVA